MSASCRAVLLAAGGQISASDLINPGQTRATPSPSPDFSALPYNQAKEEALILFSQQYLSRALEQAAGNISVAARQTGLGRQSLQRLLKRYALEAAAFRKEPGSGA
ncbi:MAG: helix-turn-helix domain-containing protein [Desulfurivibrionaceae bacterium]|nr:helix-turn-helix domain-containing protein [Desulfurivibrionaceae bacterium]